MEFDNSTLKELAISETGLIFDPATGTIYTSNPVGLLILEALKEGKEAIEISSMIAGRYAVDQQTAERDLYEFLSQLNNTGLITYA